MGSTNFWKCPSDSATHRRYSSFINVIFNDLTARGIALPYIDELIIPGIDETDAIANLKLMLGRAKDYGLEINKKKCSLLQRRIEFLSYVIEKRQNIIWQDESRYEVSTTAYD